MSTITIIAGSDGISPSRTVINTNFSNLNTDKIETSVLDTDTALTANSDSKVATQKAVKAYVDAISPTLTFAGVRAKQAAATSVATGVFTALTFTAEDFDTSGYHDIATNTSRLTVPAGKAGKYAIGGSVYFGTAGLYASLKIKLNGATVIANGGGNADTGTGTAGIAAINTIYDLSVSDYVEILASHGDGGSQSTSGDLKTNFWMYRIG